LEIIIFKYIVKRKTFIKCVVFKQSKNQVDDKTVTT